MIFIEINDGISIRKDEIVCVERKDNMNCTVTTENGTYDSKYPYSTILMLLEMGNVEEKVGYTQRESYKDNLSGQRSQFWAG